eukprot:7174728-Prymnesium_polylepis.1
MIRVSRQPPQLLKTPTIRFCDITLLGWEPHLPFYWNLLLRCKEPDPVEGVGPNPHRILAGELLPDRLRPEPLTCPLHGFRYDGLNFGLRHFSQIDVCWLMHTTFWEPAPVDVTARVPRY